MWQYIMKCIKSSLQITFSSIYTRAFLTEFAAKNFFLLYRLIFTAKRTLSAVTSGVMTIIWSSSLRNFFRDWGSYSVACINIRVKIKNTRKRIFCNADTNFNGSIKTHENISAIFLLHFVLTKNKIIRKNI